ncbi:MAG: ATP-binding protein, partial [Cyanobacteria bacterium J06627_28]
QETQAKLIQSEKMSALGQLVGGLAHEINNPINFIHGNLNHANNYVIDLLDILALYQQEYPQDNEIIQSAIEDTDLTFIQQDCLHLFESMRKGTRRISQIILDLRNFSRLDEAELKAVDLRSGLESALGLLAHRIETARPAIEIVKSYGNLPLVTCYASQLNQVFFSLLSNAIDALQNQSTDRSPVISICTQQLDNDVVRISITDNGTGVPTAIKDRIFEPFFTTKRVGDGTGLGLSMSYAILKQHSGTILCHSQKGAGTEMVVELPIHPSAHSSVHPSAHPSVHSSAMSETPRSVPQEGVPAVQAH